MAGQMKRIIKFLWPGDKKKLSHFLFVLKEKLYRRGMVSAVNFLIHIFSNRARAEDRRIIGIWDFEHGNLALGTLMDLQLRLLCMAYLNKVSKIDIAFVFSPITSAKFASYITPSNLHYHMLSEMFPLLKINPLLGSVFFFDSRDSFEKFFLKNKNKYHSFPSYFDYVNGRGPVKENYMFMEKFYSKKGFMPEFVFNETTVAWTKAFIKKYVGDKAMITVNLRLNRFFSSNRNSDIQTWIEFFEYAKKNNPDATFVVLGRKNEVSELSACSNVIFSKDHGAGIEQELSLIKHSLFHMGMLSGPVTLALCSENIPYIIINFKHPDTRYHLPWANPNKFLPWRNKTLQRLVWGKETTEILIEEFKDLMRRLDKEEWKKKLDLDRARLEVLEWPYL